jgi:hypothetical protein
MKLPTADAATVSELLMLCSVIGDGVASPFPITQGLVFSSVTPQAASDNLKRAEHKFTDWAELQRKPERDELERLEDSPSILAAAQPTAAAASKKRIRQLKEDLARYPYSTWRDSTVSRRDMIEAMKLSLFNAMSFVDANGVRMAKSLSYKRDLAEDMGWVDLTEGTSEITLIRATSGGSKVHSLSGDGGPKFNYFSRTSDDTVRFFVEKVIKSMTGAPARGLTIAIPGRIADTAPAVFNEATIFATLKRVFAKGGSDDRHFVTFETEQLKAEWDEFLRWDLDKFHTGNLSDASMKAYDTMPASPTTMTKFASKATMTLLVLSAVSDAEASGKQHLAPLVFTAEHLTFAKDAAMMIFRASSGVDKLERRNNHAEKASAFFTSAEKVCNAEKALYAAISQSEDQKISHKTAIRTPGITAGLLEILVARDHRFVELKGAENIGMGKTKRAYVLKHGLTIDPDEANAELAAAQEEWDAHPESVDEADVRREFRSLQDAATDRSVNDYAAIPIANMTPKQIRLVPAIKALYADQVCLRGTSENPEPTFLLERDEDEPAAFTGETPNLWFRYTSQLKDQHNWTIASTLGFAEAWGKPLGQIQPEN